MSLISIGEIVECLNTQEVTLLVPTSGGYDDRGRYIPAGESTEISVLADVQPASGRILQNVPEGERTKDHVSAWFTELVDTTNEALSQRSVQLVYRGTIWKCIAVPEDWRENGFVECLFQNTKKEYVG